MHNKDISLLHDFTGTLQDATGFVAEHEELEVPVTSDRSNSRLDALVRTRTPNGDVCLLAIELKRVAYPRDVRMAISQLAEYRDVISNDERVELCLIADQISPGSRQALREAGINYFDQSGTLYFRHQTWLVDVERPPLRVSRRKDVALFSGAREQVVHALLHHWHTYSGDEYISGTELSSLAHTSTFTVSSTMQGLEQLDLVESKGSGPAQRRRVRDPAALLDAWAEEWVRRRETRTRWYTYAPGGNITDKVIESFIKHSQNQWALTGAAAANAVVPRLTNVDRVEVIIQPGEADELASAMGLTKAEKGSNVILIERSGASLMFLDEHPERPNSRFASRFIQYLDLLNGYGRNKELAEEFRKQALKIESSK
ncbi:type IV toxin-antitoxin system AbiEi family antitoxin [Massilia alkalitolerans]|uniref:type IV toxin-antitoxin system AbiEi family antitoxin n=1 Tax=Massilia alkalitolerans TaxID=286638 RepID=UPI000A04015C|nr:type IV toxin-antitoxin system AbiEi family antitoxin [Massilia alkalitolerans]